jgi:hypothetical protein
VSVKVGEHKLLPAVRALSPHALVMTDGFSCRSQIEQGTERRALHLAQVAQMALHEGPNGPALSPPEARYLTAPSVDGRERRSLALAAGAAGAVGLAAAGLAARRS